MNLTILIIICFMSILISILVLIRIFKGKVILKKNADISSVSFNIEKSGYYGIWISGKIMKAVSLDKRNVGITDSRGVKKKSIKSLFNPKINGFKNGRFLLKYYYLNDGEYEFKISSEQENSLSFLAKFTINRISFSRSTNFTYELRKTFPEFILPLVLLGILLPMFQLLKIIETMNN